MSKIHYVRRTTAPSNILFSVDELGQWTTYHKTAQNCQDYLERNYPGELVDWDTTQVIPFGESDIL